MISFILFHMENLSSAVKSWGIARWNYTLEATAVAWAGWQQWLILGVAIQRFINHWGLIILNAIIIILLHSPHPAVSDIKAQLMSIQPTARTCVQRYQEVYPEGDLDHGRVLCVNMHGMAAIAMAAKSFMIWILPVVAEAFFVTTIVPFTTAIIWTRLSDWSHLGRTTKKTQ